MSATTTKSAVTSFIRQAEPLNVDRLGVKASLQMPREGINIKRYNA